MSHSKYLIYKTLYMMAGAIGGADWIFLPELTEAVAEGKPNGASR